MAAIVRIRGDDGKVYDIPAIVGPPGPAGPIGKSAYELAVENGGYTGSLEDFSKRLASLASADIYEGETGDIEDGGTGGEDIPDSGGDNTTPDTGYTARLVCALIGEASDSTAYIAYSLDGGSTWVNVYGENTYISNVERIRFKRVDESEVVATLIVYDTDYTLTESTDFVFAIGEESTENSGGTDDSGSTEEDSTVHVTNVSLNAATAEIEVGDTLQLVHTVEPENATNKNVYYKSFNEDIATVSETGLVTALAEGQALISCIPVDYTDAVVEVGQIEITVTAASDSGDSGDSGDTTEYPRIYITFNLTGNAKQDTEYIAFTLNQIDYIPLSAANDSNIACYPALGVGFKKLVSSATITNVTDSQEYPSLMFGKQYYFTEDIHVTFTISE